MLLIHTALHPEAAPFIQHFKLRKHMQLKGFEVFSNDNFTLIVSGIGKIRAAIATTFLCSNFKQAASCIFSFGMCASHPTNALGSILQANKILDISSKREYYPDIILEFKVKSGSLGTSDLVLSSSENIPPGIDCWDMEASGFFEAASLFFRADEIFCFKVVSDHFAPHTLNKNIIQNLMQVNLEAF